MARCREHILRIEITETFIFLMHAMASLVSEASSPICLFAKTEMQKCTGSSLLSLCIKADRPALSFVHFELTAIKVSRDKKLFLFQGCH